jgi:hypothetical protein
MPQSAGRMTYVLASRCISRRDGAADRVRSLTGPGARRIGRPTTAYEAHERCLTRLEGLRCSVIRIVVPTLAVQSARPATGWSIGLWVAAMTGCSAAIDR